ncbi:MAG: hypothetical protein ACLTSZ_17305 [Lachnospiraceae bacterium]
MLKEKDPNFTGADIRNGMTAVVSIKHPDPRFEGQTKTKLDNQDAARAVGKVTGDEIVRYFDLQPGVPKGDSSPVRKSPQRSGSPRSVPKRTCSRSRNTPSTAMASSQIARAATRRSARSLS